MTPAEWPGRLVARVPLPIQGKLAAAFFVMVLLLVAVGAVGLQVLSGANGRAEELGTLQLKVGAYRQLQNNVTGQLYLGASAFSASDAETLDSTLRQLNQSTYDFDRLQFVTQGQIGPDETELLGQIENDYGDFGAVMIQVVELVRDGNTAEAQDLQRTQAQPLADQLERLTNELVNKAEADMVTTIAQNSDAYGTSRWTVIGLAVGSIALALVLGYAIASSLSGSVRRMDTHLRKVASGDFSHRVQVPNRDELGALAANLNRMSEELGRLYQELELASRHKSEFLANMSHELRTPLNAIIGFSEVLQERMFGELNEKQDEYVRDIVESGKHLLSLINDILDLSKVEAGSMHLEPEPVQAAPLVKSCVAVVRERALTRRIELAVDLEPGLDAFEADSRKFKQIAVNLLSNAVKFSGHGGRVAVALRRADGARLAAVGAAAGRLLSAADGATDFVELAVEDTGAGIAPDDLLRLFEPFVQVDASLQRRHEGTGLGLALVWRLVELHRGAVAVASQLGRGSRFTVWLPYRAASPAPLQPPLPAPTRAVPLALVIEDDDAAARLLTRELEAQGLAVTRAATAEEGLVLARRHHPDLIALDIFLPHIDGWECLDRLKADEQTADIPVVIVTTGAEPKRGLALGAVRVLQKPVAREALLDVLARLSLSAPAATVLVVDDDPAAVEVAATHLQAAGMAVLRAYDGRQGIALALAERPALIVLDLVMPEVSGFDVVLALKAEVHGRMIPIVVVSAKRITAEERRLLNGQVLQVLEKGRFRSADFVAEVRRALAATRLCADPARGAG
jgi:signal transduction histidine kinase/DNA-binding response OmpR family regulator